MHGFWAWKGGAENNRVGYVHKGYSGPESWTLMSFFIISQAQVIPEDRESAVIITGGTHPPSDTPMPQ